MNQHTVEEKLSKNRLVDGWDGGGIEGRCVELGFKNEHEKNNI
jgi:hypothetical protein